MSSHSRSARPFALLAALSSVIVLAVSACSSGSSASGAGSSPAASSSSASPVSATSAPPGGSGQYPFLPASVRADYVGASYFTRVRPSPYGSWKRPKPPWTFCQSESYTANTWRQGLDDELTRLVGELWHQHLATGPLKLSNSNNNLNVQLTQINNFVTEGCNVIFSVPVSPTGLCSAIDHAYSAGVLVVTLGSPVYCSTGMNLDYNEYDGGYQTAAALAREMGGRGGVLVVNAIPGLSVTTARQQGALAALQKTGDSVIGQINGDWTPSVAKSAAIQFLATHPQPIGGVWQAGLMSSAVYQAFTQAGRPAPKIADYAGDCAELAFWEKSSLADFSLWDAGQTPAYQGVLTAVRMLQGAQPVTNTLLYQLPTITPGNFSQWYKPGMTMASTCYPVPPAGQRVPDSALNALFTHLPAKPVQLAY